MKREKVAQIQSSRLFVECNRKEIQGFARHEWVNGKRETIQAVCAYAACGGFATAISDSGKSCRRLKRIGDSTHP
jgi:isoaspartyl peptidase/L-asparaginase-like protein (Ntn-hydrolase superfamily)